MADGAASPARPSSDVASPVESAPAPSSSTSSSSASAPRRRAARGRARSTGPRSPGPRSSPAPGRRARHTPRSPGRARRRARPPPTGTTSARGRRSRPGRGHGPGPTVSAIRASVGRYTSRSQRSAASCGSTGSARLVLEPRVVLVQVVEQQLGLALEGPDPRPPLDLAGVEAARRDVHPEPDPVVAARRVDGQVDRVAEIVQPPDPGPDRLAVAGPEDRLVVELASRRPGSVSRTRSAASIDSSGSRCALHRGEVGEAEGDVLDEDLGVVLALAVGQRRMDLARLRVDEVGLDPVAVAAEQRVGERAVAPVDAVAVEVDEEERHRVEEPVAVDARAGRQAHEQPAVLERVGEVLRREDRRRPLRDLRDAGRGDGRQRRPTRGGGGRRTRAGRPPSGSSLSAYRVPSAVRNRTRWRDGPTGSSRNASCSVGPVGERRSPTAARRARSPDRGAGAGGRRTSVGSESTRSRGTRGDQVLVRAASSDRPRPTRRSPAIRTGAGRRHGGGRR